MLMALPKNWYQSSCAAAAQLHGLDELLVEAVAYQESGWQTHAYRYEPAFWLRYLATNPRYRNDNPQRVSASYGLMQIMYPTAWDIGYADVPEMLFIPEVGLEWGCRYLAKLIEWAKGNVEQALAAYNGGKGGNEKPPFRNAGYSLQVLAHLQTFKA